MWQFLRNALQNESILNTEQKGRASWAILPGLDLLPRPPSSLSDVLAASQWKRLGPWLSESEQVLDNSLLSRPSSQAWEDYPNYPTWSKSAQSPSRVKTNLLIYKEGQRVGTDFFFFLCSANCSQETETLMTSRCICSFSIFLLRCSGLEPIS